MAKRIGLKKTSSGAAGIGVVESTRECRGDYDGPAGAGRVCIRFGEPKKPTKEDKYPASPPTTDLILPMSVVRTVKLGDKVRIRLEVIE